MVRLLLVPVILATGLLASCGGSSKTAAQTETTAPVTQPTTTTATQPTATTATTSATPSALQAEAASAATGDVPDNQVFLVFRNARAGYSMDYPEGWAQQGSGRTVTFRDKNNIVRVVVASGKPPTVADARKQVRSLPGVRIESGPEAVTISGRPAVKVVYSTQSAPNPVTGKKVTLVVDRYYLAHGRQEAIVDLGTPQGVDNVDAFRRMIQSLRWS